MRRKRLLLGLGLALTIGLGWHEARAIREQREALATARAGMERLEIEIAAVRRGSEPLQRDLAAAARQRAALPAAAANPTGSDPAHAGEIRDWLARVKRLKQIFAEQPAQRIPELALLAEADWIRPAQDPLDSEVRVRMALAAIREQGRLRFRPAVVMALRRYEIATANPGPADIQVLAPYFDPPVDPAMLQQYELVWSGSRTEPQLTFQPRVAVDEIYDGRSNIDSRGGGTISSGSPGDWIPDFFAREQRALVAYARAHPGTSQPASMRQLAPFFDPPLSAAVIEGFEALQRERERLR